MNVKALALRPFHGIFDTQYATVASWQTIKRELVPHHIVTHSRRLLYEFRTHFHPYAERLVAELVEKDIEGLEALDTAVPELREEFFEDRYKPKTAVALRTAADFGSDPAAVLARVLGPDDKPVRELLPVNELDFDYASGAYAVYNWEVFFHIPFAIALQLSRNQRYEEAQRWFHFIFDPTDNSDGPTPQRFWKVKPFQIDEVEHVETTLFNLSTGDDPDLQQRTIAAIGAWRDKPFRPHLVARTRPTMYMYATAMAYLDNLIDWGDSFFRQDTRESINEAMQYYVLAANVLGPRPEAIPKKGSLIRQTYASLRNDLDEFGNAVRELEAEIPFDLVGAAPPIEGTPEDAPLESLGRSLYFCVPRNDRLLGYWDTVGDRLYKIRNSLNLEGVFRQLPLFPPPIDPAMLARAIAAGVDVASVVSGTAAPLSPVRFHILLQKAVEICQEVKSLGSQILSALEKKDNEALSVLRAKHESNLLGLAETVKYAQWQEAIKNREGVSRSLENAARRYIYYERLLGRQETDIKIPELDSLDIAALEDERLEATEPQIGPRKIEVDVSSAAEILTGGRKLSSYELAELILLEVGRASHDAAAGLEIVGMGLSLIPQIGAAGEPLGVGVRTSFGGEQLSKMFSMMASGTRTIADRITFEASNVAKVGSYARREQEWALQANAAAGEMNQLYKQFRSAELREYIAKREYDNHQKQVAQAKDVEDFLTNEKRKSTTEGFYLWMKREAQGLHAQYFQLAYDVAKKAERAFQHELGDPSASFIQTGYLAGREGLFAGEKLHLDLKRMDMAYAELHAREFEITKHVSLRDWFPLQLLDLRTKGKCVVDIPEALIDLDCPGHIFRRHRFISVTIPSISGPYASVNCSLSQTLSYMRTKATALGGQWYPADPNDPDTDRFTVYPVSVESIVTSSAQNDSGMFEPNLHDEQYLPFEARGLNGRFVIQLLGKPPQFDHYSIADLILTFRYTARPGAAPDTVSAAAATWLQNNAASLFSMRQEFPSEWARFKRAQVSAGQKVSLAFELGDQHFPYRMQQALVSAKQLHIRGRTSNSQVAVELVRGTTAWDGGTLIDGECTLNPPQQAGKPGTFDPRGGFELRFETNEFEDLWLVVDWSAGTG